MPGAAVGAACPRVTWRPRVIHVERPDPCLKAVGSEVSRREQQWSGTDSTRSSSQSRCQETVLAHGDLFPDGSTPGKGLGPGAPEAVTLSLSHRVLT